jgi:mono/diheme cytochrome c family protein
MRRSFPFAITAFTLLALAAPGQAKPAFVQKAKALGFTDVTSCASCHSGTPKKGGAFTPMGQYLVDQKAARKADEVDVAWLKGYKK